MSAVDLVTAETLYRLGPEARFELVEGELVGYPTHGGMHGEVLARIAVHVGMHVRANRLGTVYLGQVGHILRRDPDTVLAPDLSSIRTERDTDEEDRFLTMAPDLVVEVVESYETPEWIERKVGIFLDAGVEQVWIADPVRSGFWVHSDGFPVSAYCLDDIVSGGDILPGFEMWVSGLTMQR